jgi:hypothetical protein
MSPLTQEEAAGYWVRAPDWELLDAAKRIDPEITFGSGYATISMHTKKIKGLH